MLSGSWCRSLRGEHWWTRRQVAVAEPVTTNDVSHSNSHCAVSTTTTHTSSLAEITVWEWTSILHLERAEIVHRNTNHSSNGKLIFSQGLVLCLRLLLGVIPLIDVLWTHFDSSILYPSKLFKCSGQLVFQLQGRSWLSVYAHVHISYIMLPHLLSWWILIFCLHAFLDMEYQF